jgi:hypothetical protein
MTRERINAQRAMTLHKRVLLIVVNKETLDATGHLKHKACFVGTILGNVGSPPTIDLIGVINALDRYGYRLIKNSDG